MAQNLVESASGTTLKTGCIVDATGTVWSLAASPTSGLQVVKGGTVDSTTANVTLLLYYNHKVYQQNAAGGWWSWSNSAWANAGDPRVVQPTPSTTESKSGSTLSSTTGSLVDKQGATWTLVNSASGMQIARNGQADSATANVTLLLYQTGVIYQQNSAGGWWSWSNSTWANATDPRSTTSTPISTPAPTSAPSSGSGPSVSGGMLSVDFAAQTGRVAPAALWGIAAAAPQDYHYQMCNDQTFLAAAEKIKPALYRINSNSGGNGYWSDQIFANGVNNPDWSVIQPFIQNGYRWVSDSCRLIIGIRFNAMNVTDYATACKALATHIKNTNGGNGKPLTVWGWEVGNEDDGSTDINTYCRYFNAAADALHSVDPNYKVIGTVDSYVQGGRMTSFAQQCGSKIGAICYHAYAYCRGSDPVPSDSQLLTASRPASDARTARSAVANTAAANVPIFVGEWNMDCAAQNEPRQQQPIGAVFCATWMLNAFNAHVGVEMGAMWEMAADGTYGVIQGSNISAQGYFLSKAGAVMGGQEVSSKFANAGNHSCLAVVNGSKIGVMIVNYDTNNAAISGKVALSQWPGGTTGNGTLNKWEISNSNPSGNLSTINVSAGMTDQINVPGCSVVMLYN